MWIPEIRKAWRMASVQVPVIASIVWGVWINLSQSEQAAIAAVIGLDPERWMPLLAFGGTVLARVIAQPGLHRE